MEQRLAKNQRISWNQRFESKTQKSRFLIHRFETRSQKSWFSILWFESKSRKRDSWFIRNRIRKNDSTVSNQLILSQSLARNHNLWTVFHDRQKTGPAPNHPENNWSKVFGRRYSTQWRPYPSTFPRSSDAWEKLNRKFPRWFTLTSAGRSPALASPHENEILPIFATLFKRGDFSRENWRKFSTNPVSCIFSQISALYSDKEWSAQSVYHPDNAKPLHNLATSYATTLKSHKNQIKLIFRSKFHLFEKTPLYTDKPLFWKTRKSYLISHRKCQFSDFSIYWL